MVIVSVQKCLASIYVVLKLPMFNFDSGFMLALMLVGQF